MTRLAALALLSAFLAQPALADVRPTEVSRTVTVTYSWRLACSSSATGLPAQCSFGIVRGTESKCANVTRNANALTVATYTGAELGPTERIPVTYYDAPDCGGPGVAMPDGLSLQGATRGVLLLP